MSLSVIGPIEIPGTDATAAVGIGPDILQNGPRLGRTRGGSAASTCPGRNAQKRMGLPRRDQSSGPLDGRLFVVRCPPSRCEGGFDRPVPIAGVPRGHRDEAEACTIAPHTDPIPVPPQGRDLVLRQRRMSVCIGHLSEELVDTDSFVGP